MAEKEGLNIEVRPVIVSELVDAAKNGSLKEIFGAGTAAVISVIKGFSYKDEYYEMAPIENSYASFLKEKLTNLQNKLTEDTYGWTVKVQ
jgi:branched-chain amino acid aminotransferase